MKWPTKKRSSDLPRFRVEFEGGGVYHTSAASEDKAMGNVAWRYAQDMGMDVRMVMWWRMKNGELNYWITEEGQE